MVQGALTKLYQAWNRVSRHEVPDADVRRILVRLFLDERRRGWWRRESPPDDLTDRPYRKGQAGKSAGAHRPASAAGLPC